MSLWEHTLPASGTPNKALWAALFPQLARIQSGKHLALIPVPAHCFWTDSSGDRYPALLPKNKGSGPSQPPMDSVCGRKGRGTSGDKSSYILRQLLPQLLTSLVCRLSLSPAHWHAPHISAPFLTRAPCITLWPHPGLTQNTEWDAKTAPFGWKKYPG